MKKENNKGKFNQLINEDRRKLLGLAGVASAGALLSPLISKAAPSTIIEAGSNVDTASYVVFKDGNIIYAKNGTTGKIDFQGSDASGVIQGAIDALTNGGKIFIKSGVYAIGKSINFPNNYIVIEGEGYSTRLFLANNANCPLFYEDRSGGPSTIHKCVIRNMKLDGNKDNNTSGTAIKMYGWYMSRIEKLWIENFKDEGIYLGKQGSQNSLDNWIESVYVLTCNGSALKMIGITDTFISNCNFSSTNSAIYLETCGTIEFNNIHTWNVNGHNEIYIKSCGRIFVNNAYVESLNATNKIYLEDGNNWEIFLSNVVINGRDNSCTGDGIYFGTSSSFLYINNCEIKNCGGYGIQLKSSRVSIIGGCIRENSKGGIYIDGIGAYGMVSIMGVEIVRNSVGNAGTYHGIEFANSAGGISVVGNTIRDYSTANQGYGIYENTGCGYNMIMGNRIVGNLLGQIYSQNNSIIKSNSGYKTESNVLSPAYSIDSVGVKMITISHGLSITPKTQDCYLTVIQNTPTDDWEYTTLKVVSADATNVIAKINISKASATSGATAKLGLRVGNA